MTAQEIVGDFAGSATIHGAPRILSSQSTFRKVLWGFIFLGAVTLSIYHIAILLQLYLEYPTGVRIEVKKENATFPWITVCSIDPYSKVGPSLDILDESFYTFLEEVFYEAVDIISLQADSDSLRFVDNLERQDKSYGDHLFPAKVWPLFKEDFLDIDVVKESSLKLGHFIPVCKYGGHLCNRSNVITTFNYDYNNCFTIIPSDKIKAKAGLENGLSLVLFGALGTPDPMKAMESLMIMQDTEALFNPRSDTSNSQVILHPPFTRPNPDIGGIGVIPGEQVAIKLRSSISAKHPTPHYGCDSTDKRGKIMESLHTTPYTPCEEECFQLSLVEKCHCYDPSKLPPEGDNGTVACGYDSLTLFNQAWQACNMSGIDECFMSSETFFNNVTCIDDFKKDFSTEKCNCLPECSNVRYSSSVTKSDWPQKSYMRPGSETDQDRFTIIPHLFNYRFMHDFTESDWKNLQEVFWPEVNRSYEFAWTDVPMARQEEILSLFSVVNIYFSNTDVDYTIEARSYSFTNFLADLGGQLGLWMGLSVISAIEIFDLLFLLVSHACQRKKTKVDTIELKLAKNEYK